MLKMGQAYVLAWMGMLLVGCHAFDPDDTQPYASLTAKQLYAQAKTQQHEKNYNEAIKQYRALQTLYPTTSYTKQALLNLIEVNYLAKNEDAAISAIEDYVRLYPTGQGTAYAYFMLGMIKVNMHGSWFQRHLNVPAEKYDMEGLDDAFNAFDHVVRHFPTSRYAGQATKMMQQLRMAKAQHELETAQYYLKQDAYIAAINRARQAIALDRSRNMQQQAYQIMLTCYRHLEDPVMIKKVQHLLRTLRH